MLSHTHLLRSSACLLASLLFVQCASETVSLDYQPNLTQIVPGPAVVAVGSFTNMREEADNSLGAVRTLIGAPFQRINTSIPVEKIVSNSFAYGLRSRQMLVSRNSAAFILGGEVLNFSVRQVVRCSAHAEIRVTLTQASTGQLVFSRVYRADRESSPDMTKNDEVLSALRELGSRVLQDIVDQSLDDVSLRSRLTTPGDSAAPR